MHRAVTAARPVVRAATVAAAYPLTTLRVAAWAWTGSRRLERRLGRDGIEALDGIEPAPALPARHRTTVAAALRLRRATCLVRSAVLQRWDADHGRPRDLVIGVRGRAGRFVAHAWLEGERRGNGFVELHRHPPVSG